MKMIEKKDSPCWYKLSWIKEEKAILLRIHEDFINDFEPISSSNNLILNYMKEFKFSNFSGNLDDDFGFNRALKFMGRKNDFNEFLMKAPVVSEKSNKICSNCKGSGKNWTGDTCFQCNGSGKEDSYSWRSADETAVSFSILSRALRYFEKDTSTTFPQLFTVETMAKKILSHGSSLGGTYSVSFCDWLRSLDTNIIFSETIEAMKIAYSCAFGEIIKISQFNAYLGSGKGWLVINCPGNSSGLHPSEQRGYSEKGKGYRFSCHNIDTPVQQFSLLTALSTLHDKAEKEIKL